MARSIDSPRDLEEYGFMYMTGEACGWSLRALYYMTEEGAEIYRDVVGLPYDTKFVDPQSNYTIGTQKIVAKALIPHDLFTTIAVFCLIKRGAAQIAQAPNGPVMGFFKSDSDDEVGRWFDWNHAVIEQRNTEVPDTQKTYMKVWGPVAGQPMCGTRSVHAMFGHTE